MAAAGRIRKVSTLGMQYDKAGLVWLCRGGMVCVALGANFVPVHLTLFGESFGGLNPAELGRISAVMFAGVVLGILVCGPLADRLGARLFAAGGAVMNCSGLLAFALADSYAALLAASAIAGFGAGTLDMMMSPIVSAVRTEDRSAALNRLHAFYNVGAVCTLILGTAGILLGGPWRATALLLATIPAGVALGFLLAPLPPLVHPEHDRERLRRLLLRPRFLGALLAMVFIGATEESMAQWLPAYAERGLGFSRAAGGLSLAAFALLMGTGRLFGSYAIAYAGAHRLVFAAALGCAGLFLAASLSPYAPLAVVACACAGLACSVYWPTNLGLTADRMPHGGASMFALLAAAGNAGCALGPWTAGHIARTTELRTAMLCGAAWPLLLALAIALIWQADRRKGLTVR